MTDLQILTPKQTRFLRCFEACASVTQAARWAKVTRQTHYDWMEESTAYVQAFAKAEKVAGKTLEDEAVRRAHEGCRRAIRYKGKIVGYEYEYSDTLLLALLKGFLPEKYRDKWAGELTGKDGTPLTGDLSQLRIVLMQVLGDLTPEVRQQVSRKLLESGQE